MPSVSSKYRRNKYVQSIVPFAAILFQVQVTRHASDGKNCRGAKIEVKLYGRISRDPWPIRR